ncbi:MAG: glutathione S-transferase family protein [Polyangiaceae bacterium]
MSELVLCELVDPNVEGYETWSPFCMKAHRALRFAGLTYSRRHGRIPAEFQPLNPTGQIPVLLVDGTPVADSSRILRKVDELAGTSLTKSAEARLWEELADTSLSAYLVASRWADDRNWPAVRRAYFGPAPDQVVAPIRERVIEGLHAREVWRAGPDACWANLRELLGALDERAPREGFWLGAELTAADIGLFAMVHGLRAPLSPPQAEEVARRERLTAYIDRVHAATKG